MADYNTESRRIKGRTVEQAQRVISEIETNIGSIQEILSKLEETNQAVIDYNKQLEEQRQVIADNQKIVNNPDSSKQERKDALEQLTEASNIITQLGSQVQTFAKQAEELQGPFGTYIPFRG